MAWLQQVSSGCHMAGLWQWSLRNRHVQAAMTGQVCKQVKSGWCVVVLVHGMYAIDSTGTQPGMQTVMSMQPSGGPITQQLCNQTWPACVPTNVFRPQHGYPRMTKGMAAVTSAWEHMWDIVECHHMLAWVHIFTFMMVLCAGTHYCRLKYLRKWHFCVLSHVGLMFMSMVTGCCEHIYSYIDIF